MKFFSIDITLISLGEPIQIFHSNQSIKKVDFNFGTINYICLQFTVNCKQI
jgi:hypothetical protein